MSHFIEIYNGGFKIFLRKFIRLLHGIWAVPLVLVIRLIRPWKLIRIGTFLSSRIGHFVADTGSQWAEKQVNNNKNTLDLHWLPKKTSNSFWAQIVKRNFRVYRFAHLLDLWNQAIPGGTDHYLPSSTTNSRDINGYLEKSPNTMPFLPEENYLAKSWLKEQGWAENEPFVCLMIRDNTFLDKDNLNKGHDWTYHNYRDSDISTYIEAAEWLGDQGVWVIRMGKIMGKPVPSNHPKIIDYAFHPEKSDFLDVWLFAHCSLCITTGTGPDMISDVYRRPLLALNLLPIRNIFSWSNAIHLPKHLVWSSSGELLSMREYLKHSYHKTSDYSEKGIEIRDLTSDEILVAVQEAWLSITGDWVPSKNNSERQAMVWEIYKADFNFAKYHGYIHPKARFGDQWLASRSNEFFQ